MCGIAGAIGREAGVQAVRTVLALTHALRHRGPDGEGFWADTLASRGRIIREEVPGQAGIVLGHRRLSIVDLVTGDQPMSDAKGEIWLTYNGEIFNHWDLRAQLEARGHRFRTTSDSEVLIHGWREWGEDLLPRLNGMFAFALVDLRSREVVLARDPVGVKPIYIGTQPGITWWSSELGSAFDAGVVSGKLSDEALKLYLLFRFIPSPATVTENAWKLPPGHFARISHAAAGQAPVCRRYRTMVRSSADPRNEREWRDALGTELEAAVKRQLMSDVPVGSLLSGGVDSSMVTVLMRQHLPQPPVAFGIGFRSQLANSEVEAGEWAARELGVPFVATEVDDDEYLSKWPAAFGHVGEPIGNSGGLLVQLLCQTVARTHKVVLTGQGADEPLGGYPRHMGERLWRLGRRMPGLSAWASDRMIGSGAGERLGRVLRAEGRTDRYLELFAVMPTDRIDRMIPRGAPARELGRAAIERWEPDADADELNALLRVDTRLSLADDLLIVADHFSMRASVELRVPFLDIQFLDLVERMPSRYKLSRMGERKWLYRRVAARTLPPAMSRRLCGLRARLGRKVGFATPAERWLTGHGGPLSRPSEWVAPLQGIGLFSTSTWDDAAASSAGRSGMGRELLTLYTLSQWLKARSA